MFPAFKWGGLYLLSFPFFFRNIGDGATGQNTTHINLITFGVRSPSMLQVDLTEVVKETIGAELMLVGKFFV